MRYACGALVTSKPCGVLQIDNVRSIACAQGAHRVKRYFNIKQRLLEYVAIKPLFIVLNCLYPHRDGRVIRCGAGACVYTSAKPASLFASASPPLLKPKRLSLSESCLGTCSGPCPLKTLLHKPPIQYRMCRQVRIKRDRKVPCRPCRPYLESLKSLAPLLTS